MTDLEVSPQSMTIAKELSERVDEDGGIALIIDYGQDAPPGDTLRVSIYTFLNMITKRKLSTKFIYLRLSNNTSKLTPC